MNQVEVVNALNDFFNISAYDEREVWLNLLPENQRSQMRAFVAPEFWDGLWNGLMLNNTSNVERVYLVVFPTAPVLDTIIAKEVERGATGALIFAHHPLNFQERGAGFLPIPSEQLEELREHHISYYSCHAPLDCHPSISTGNALANALLLENINRFGRYYAGLAGVYGTMQATSFEQFARRVAEVCELPALRYDQTLHNARPIQRVAIVPGGGGDKAFMDEAMTLGADTYVTGHWFLFADNPFSAAHREEFASYIPVVNMNLLGASHYSSEMVVMRDQMPGWFQKQLNLETQLIRQDKPWG